jgi:hypothetical protein
LLPLSPALSPRGERVVLQAHPSNIYFKHIPPSPLQGEGRSQHPEPRDGYKPPPTKRNNPLSPAFYPRGERVVLQAHSSNTSFKHILPSTLQGEGLGMVAVTMAVLLHATLNTLSKPEGLLART